VSVNARLTCRYVIAVGNQLQHFLVHRDVLVLCERLFLFPLN
jgi:hypothetical protein